MDSEDILYSDDKSIKLEIDSDAGNFEHNGRTIGFGGDKGLVYKDAKREYEFNDSLDIREGKVRFAILNTNVFYKTKFLIGYDDYSVEYSRYEGFKARFNDDFVGFKGYTEMNRKKYIDASVQGNRIILGQDQFTYLYKGTGFSYGGKTDRIAFHNKEEKIALRRDWGISFEDGDRGFSIKKDASIVLKKGGQEIILGGRQPVKFTDTENGIDGGNAKSGDGFDFDIAGMNFNVSTEEGKKATISTSIPGIGVEVDITSHGKNLFSLDFSKFGESISLYKNVYTWGFGEPDAGPQVEQNVKMSGPQHIGYVTHGSTSLLQGKVFMGFSTKTNTFLYNGEMSGMKPIVCLNNVKFSAKFGGDDWHVKVGEPENRDSWATVEPFCAGFKPSGYFALDKNSIGMGVGQRYDKELNATVDVGVGEIGFKVSFGYDIYGEMIVRFTDPWGLDKLKVSASAYCNIKACMGGCTNVLEVEVGGSLTLKITNVEFNAKGELHATVKVFGFGPSVSFPAEISFTY